MSTSYLRFDQEPIPQHKNTVELAFSVGF